jgi:hypothetical protein
MLPRDNSRGVHPYTHYEVKYNRQDTIDKSCYIMVYVQCILRLKEM